MPTVRKLNLTVQQYVLINNLHLLLLKTKDDCDMFVLKEKIYSRLNNMGDNEEMKKELIELGKDIAKRRKVIVEKWLADKPHLIRGECNTPEMKALEQEAVRRYGEILEKYKNTDSINVLCCERVEKYD